MYLIIFGQFARLNITFIPVCLYSELNLINLEQTGTIYKKDTVQNKTVLTIKSSTYTSLSLATSPVCQ